MVELVQNRFGAFRKFTLTHLESGSYFSLLPDFGATVLEVKLRHWQVLDGYDSAEAAVSLAWSKNGFLFPFPNRLKEGRFAWKSRSFQFPINDLLYQNALHGFGLDAATKLTYVQLGASQATLALRHKYAGRFTYFPFPFEVEYIFELKTPDQFETGIFVTNDGTEEFPVGLGWHPYFRLPGKLENWKLKLPFCRKIEVDERMIPTGSQSEFDHFEKEADIAETLLDTAFQVNKSNHISEFSLRSGGLRLSVWHSPEFPYFQLFIPPNRQSIAIEPMSCNIDAFNNGNGLKILKPGERWGGKFGFAIQAGK